MELSNTPENFHREPIVLKMLDMTGALAGDDGGYRDVPVNDTGEELVSIDGEIMTRPSYDGVDEVSGQFDQKLILPGGTEHGVYARRSVLEALKAANQYLSSRYPGMRIGVVDAFRSKTRQVAGFSRKAMEVLGDNQQPDVPTLYKAGVTADGTFSLVRAVRDNSVYKEFVRDMEKSQEVIQLAEELGKDPSVVAIDLADVCANLRKASEVFSNTPTTPLNMDVPLNANNNAHAGGGAIDAFLYDADGRMLNSHVPFDWVGPEAAMDFLEQDDSFDEFKARVRTNPMLQKHLEKQGITGEITESQWKFWREAQRIMFHVMTRVGATFFTDTACNRKSSDFFGGENWHFEPGNVAYDAASGKPVYEGQSAGVVRDGGNPGHTLQKKGRGVSAPWGGDAAHEQLRQKGLLKDE